MSFSYEGGNLASRGDVVVVTFNYRVGPLGNMAGPALNGSQGISERNLITVSSYPAYHVSCQPTKSKLFDGSSSIFRHLEATLLG